MTVRILAMMQQAVIMPCILLQCFQTVDQSLLFLEVMEESNRLSKLIAKKYLGLLVLWSLALFDTLNH